MTGSATAEKGKKVLTMTEYIKNPLSGKLKGIGLDVLMWLQQPAEEVDHEDCVG